MGFVNSQFGTTVVVSPQGENIPIPHFSRVHMVEEGEKSIIVNSLFWKIQESIKVPLMTAAFSWIS